MAVATNDPKVIAKLLRALAGGDNAVASGADVILNAAAELLDPPERCPNCKRTANERGGCTNPWHHKQNY